jgi:uncharacterized membrane protein
MDTMVVVAGRYDDQSAALADFDAVKDFYRRGDLVDTYDAAVVSRDERGKVSIVRKREEPTRHGALAGLGLGLAAGVVAAALPPVALGGALVAGATGGAALGALTGHVNRGMSNRDLKEIGGFLDDGQTSLIVVAATDIHDRVVTLMAAAQDTAQERLDADVEALDAEIAAATH